MNIQKLIDRLKSRHYRMTKARQDILELLSEKPMTIHELFGRMVDLGHPNVQTIYNNLAFLEHEKILFATLNQHVKTYHLVDHDETSNTYVHIKCEANNNVFDIVEGQLKELIATTLGLSGFDVNHVDISIQGQCQHNVQSTCLKKGTCMLKELVDTHMN